MFDDDDNTQDQPTGSVSGDQPSHSYIMPAPPEEPGPAPTATTTAPAVAASPANDQLPTQNTTVSPDLPPVTTNDDLLSIKQAALQKLSPLLPQLDQPPEERFKTTMMMIQAADDQSLIKSAYEAANQITDEKARAQALLDVVNEINYFTQQNTTN